MRICIQFLRGASSGRDCSSKRRRSGPNLRPRHAVGPRTSNTGSNDATVAQVDCDDAISPLKRHEGNLLSREIATPSGDADPGTSAVATRLSLGICTVAIGRRVVASKIRTCAFTGSLITARLPSGETTMRYGSPNPRNVSIGWPLRRSSTTTMLSWLLPAHAVWPSGEIATPSG